MMNDEDVVKLRILVNEKASLQGTIAFVKQNLREGKRPLAYIHLSYKDGTHHTAMAGHFDLKFHLNILENRMNELNNEIDSL